jgi:limonene-1,2-epoxide hydrolase
LGVEHEDAARAFLMEFEGDVLDEARIDRIVGRMATDGRYHVFAWNEPCVGRDAIRSELRQQAPLFTDTNVEFLKSASCGSTVFIERIDWVTMSGVRIGVHVVGVSEIDEEGKIVSWRDYLDSSEITSRLTAPPSSGYE